MASQFQKACFNTHFTPYLQGRPVHLSAGVYRPCQNPIRCPLHQAGVTPRLGRARQGPSPVGSAANATVNTAAWRAIREAQEKVDNQALRLRYLEQQAEENYESIQALLEKPATDVDEGIDWAAATASVARGARANLANFEQQLKEAKETARGHLERTKILAREAELLKKQSGLRQEKIAWLEKQLASVPQFRPVSKKEMMELLKEQQTEETVEVVSVCALDEVAKLVAEHLRAK